MSIKIEAPYIERLPSITSSSAIGMQFDTLSKAMAHAERCDEIAEVLMINSTRIRLAVRDALDPYARPLEVGLRVEGPGQPPEYIGGLVAESEPRQKVDVSRTEIVMGGDPGRHHYTLKVDGKPVVIDQTFNVCCGVRDALIGRGGQPGELIEVADGILDAMDDVDPDSDERRYE